MKKATLCALVLLVTQSLGFLWFPSNLELIGGGQNGGTDCAVCTILISTIWNYGGYKGIAYDQALKEICSLTPQPVKDACIVFADLEGATIQRLLSEGETPDVVCNSIKDAPCKQETAVCRLYGKDTSEDVFRKRISAARERLGHSPRPLTELRPHIPRDMRIPVKMNKESWFCKHFPPICAIINKLSNDHLPIEDIDGDYYSTVPTLRGTDWRGKDCEDEMKNVYPGRHSEHDTIIDTNCNGIKGVNPNTLKPYEEELCKGTQSMGSLVLGDSASAHFHLPPHWFNVTEITKGTYDLLFYAIENELDWPMLSLHTAYVNSSQHWSPTINGPASSFYKNMYENNRCNHRDYQNMGVNGASSRNIHPWANYFARNQTLDKPLYVTIALIGNDVCGSSPDPSHMTTPQEYYAAMKELIELVDSRVPSGSSLSTVGLVDGRVLWNSMWDRIHPIGAYKNDVTYEDVYTYLNCLDTSPCAGWMNSNETTRNATSARASELNAALAQLVTDLKPTLKNIKIHNLGNAITRVIEDWVKQGGQTYELIEPMDGFHPNQLANWFAGETIWKEVSAAGLVPPPNPHNSEIQRLFGDQGGY